MSIFFCNATSSLSRWSAPIWAIRGIRMRKPASKGIRYGATVISGNQTQTRRRPDASASEYWPIAHLHQLLHRDRQIAHPLAGGMEHGICDGSSSADYADFTNCLAAEGASVKVRLAD